MRFDGMYISLELRALIFVEFKLIHRLPQRLEKRFEFLKAALVNNGERLRSAGTSLLNRRVRYRPSVNNANRSKVVSWFIWLAPCLFDPTNSFVSERNLNNYRA